jgi:undecaprenyl-diphosphatase
MDILQKILELDTKVFLFLNGYHSDYWDTIMLMITRKEPWFPFFAVILFYVIKIYRKKSWLILLFIGITILLSDQISVYLKESIQRFRPVHNPDIEDIVHNVLRKGSLYGFVSSHAANVFAIFVITTRLFKNKRFWVLMMSWAVVVSYSRIYSGVHYPLDIISGALLGWLIGYFTYKLMMLVESQFFPAINPKIEKTFLSLSQWDNIMLVFSVLASTVFIMAYILHHYNYL